MIRYTGQPEALKKISLERVEQCLGEALSALSDEGLSVTITGFHLHPAKGPGRQPATVRMELEIHSQTVEVPAPF